MFTLWRHGVISQYAEKCWSHISRNLCYYKWVRVSEAVKKYYYRYTEACWLFGKLTAPVRRHWSQVSSISKLSWPHSFLFWHNCSVNIMQEWRLRYFVPSVAIVLNSLWFIRIMTYMKRFLSIVYLNCNIRKSHLSFLYYKDFEFVIATVCFYDMLHCFALLVMM